MRMSKKYLLAVLAAMAMLIFGGVFTVSAYTYTPENCKHHTYQQWDKDANALGRYNNTFSEVGVTNKDTNKCRLCGYECNHPLEYRTYLSTDYASNYHYENGKHYLKGTCTFCASGTTIVGGEGLTNNRTPLINRANGQACKLTTKQNMPYPNVKDSHTTKCSVCNHSETANCTFSITYKPKYVSSGSNKSYISDYHNIIYKCKVCKGDKAYASHSGSHKFSNNKCTRCAYKIIKPGATKVLSAKQSAAAKVKTTKGGGYWQKTYVGSSGAKWKWIKPYSVTKRTYPIALQLKKATNGYSYLVSTNKNFTAGTTQRFGKYNLTYNYSVSNSKRPTSVKLYIKVMSKTGQYSKVITKTVRLRN